MMDQFLEQLDTLTRELDKSERESLRQILKMPALRIALAQVLLERSQLAGELIARRFATADDALAVASRMNGQVLGLTRAVEKLFELADIREEEEEENA